MMLIENQEKTIASTCWSKEDAENILGFSNYPATTENIETLWNAMQYYEDDIVEHMCDAAWHYIGGILADLAEAGDIQKNNLEEE